MIKIKSLQTKGIFGCLCQVEVHSIACEFLVTNGNQEQISSLLDAETGDRYLIESPVGKNVFWHHTLRRVNASI